jgi:hypothetical protein
MSRELRNSSPGRAGASSTSGFRPITFPTISASSSTLVCLPVAMLKAVSSMLVPAGTAAVLASTLARATSRTKT